MFVCGEQYSWLQPNTLQLASFSRPGTPHKRDFLFLGMASYGRYV